MKIRNGFVSNSSSSSFVAKGYLVNSIDIEKVCEFIKELAPDIYETVKKNSEVNTEEFVCEAGSFYRFPVSIKKGNSENGIPEGDWFIGEDFIIGDESGYLPEKIIKVTPSDNLKKLKDLLGINQELVIVVGNCVS